MKSLLFFLFFLVSLHLSAQNQALYYFDKELNEFTGRFPSLSVMGEKGKFEEEIVGNLANKGYIPYIFFKQSFILLNNHL